MSTFNTTVALFAATLMASACTINIIPPSDSEDATEEDVQTFEDTGESEQEQEDTGLVGEDTGQDDVEEEDTAQEEEEGYAQVSVCNQLTAGGDNVRLEVSCGDVTWIADSMDCSGCQAIRAGTYNCDFDFQVTSTTGTLLEGQIEFEAGDEFIWLSGLSDDSEPLIYHVNTACDLDYDELIAELNE